MHLFTSTRANGDHNELGKWQGGPGEAYEFFPSSWVSSKTTDASDMTRQCKGFFQFLRALKFTKTVVSGLFPSFRAWPGLS